MGGWPASAASAPAHRERIGLPRRSSTSSNPTAARPRGRAAFRLVLGTHVTGIEQDARSVRALLANGGTVEGDAIVAADGIRSRVRQCLLGSDEPIVLGHRCLPRCGGGGADRTCPSSRLEPRAWSRTPCCCVLDRWRSPARAQCRSGGRRERARIVEDETSNAEVRGYFGGWQDELLSGSP